MYYTVYKTTNLINGKFYIGKHQTKVLHDGYLGSGKRLKYAFAKYGIENFAFEYLGIFDEEWKMNLAEKIYVVLDKEMSYNLCPGGQGGFGYINKNSLNTYENHGVLAGKKAQEIIRKRRSEDSEFEKIFISQMRERQKNSRKVLDKKYPKGAGTFKGKKHSKETILKMSKSKNKSESNSQFGSMWITDGVISLKINKESVIPENFRKGRIIKKDSI